MPKLVWDGTGERLFETGVDRGVLYPADTDGTYKEGVVWNGLVNVTEKDTGGESNPQYADNIKYLNLISADEFEGTIEAFTYPDEFAECDGSAEPEEGVRIGQQRRKKFGFSYRTLIGNDTEGTDYGYKIHLVYGAQAEPSEKSRDTINDSPEASTLSWDLTTTPVPVNVGNLKPTAHITIDSTKVSPEALSELEEMLYGTEEGQPSLPLPAAVLDLFAA